MEQTPTPSAKPAGLLLTLGAAAYDALLVAAILFIAAAIAVLVNSGEAVASEQLWFKIYLVVAAFPYFGWCWSRSGQTLGMKTWRIVLQRADGTPPDLADALRRYLVAIISWAAFMLGFAWMLIDPKKRSWHDLASATQLMRMPKN